MAIHAGVYMNHNASTAVVVRVKDGLVYYLTMISGAIEFKKASVAKFERDWPKYLPSYPAVRAVQKYHSCELTRTEDADKIMRLVLTNARLPARNREAG